MSILKYFVIASSYAAPKSAANDKYCLERTLWGTVMPGGVIQTFSASDGGLYIIKKY